MLHPLHPVLHAATPCTPARRRVCPQAGTLLCTRSISFLVGSVLLPHFKAEATTRTSAQQHAKRQRALQAQIDEGAAGGAPGSGGDADSRDTSPPVRRQSLMAQLSERLTGAGGEAQGGPCTVEPSCDPAVLLAAESGVGMAAARADAQLQQADRPKAPRAAPLQPFAAPLPPHGGSLYRPP